MRRRAATGTDQVPYKLVVVGSAGVGKSALTMAAPHLERVRAFPYLERARHAALQYPVWGPGSVDVCVYSPFL